MMTLSTTVIKRYFAVQASKNLFQTGCGTPLMGPTQVFLKEVRGRMGFHSAL